MVQLTVICVLVLSIACSQAVPAKKYPSVTKYGKGGSGGGGGGGVIGGITSGGAYGSQHGCGTHAHWVAKASACRCDMGCAGDPYQGCYLISGTVNAVNRIGPSAAQIRGFNNGLDAAVGSLFAQDNARALSAHAASNAGIRADLANAARGGAQFDSTADINFLNGAIAAGQRLANQYRGGTGGLLTRVGALGTSGRSSAVATGAAGGASASAGGGASSAIVGGIGSGAGAGAGIGGGSGIGGGILIGGGRVGGCGVLASLSGGVCVCNPGCWGNPYVRCYDHCGAYAYRSGNACVCKSGYSGNAYSGCSVVSVGGGKGGY